MGGRPGLGSVTVLTKFIFRILDIYIIILVIIIFLNGFTKVSLVALQGATRETLVNPLLKFMMMRYVIYKMIIYDIAD